MKKSNKFLKKIATITLSCTSLLQFTSVFAEGPENSNVGKSQLSALLTETAKTTTSTTTEQTLAPGLKAKLQAKLHDQPPTIKLRNLEYPANVLEITSFADFKKIKPRYRLFDIMAFRNIH